MVDTRMNLIKALQENTDNKTYYCNLKYKDQSIDIYCMLK